METVELVIKIPEELYKAYKGRPPMLGDAGLDMIAQSIANGTVLPKGRDGLVELGKVIDIVTEYVPDDDGSVGNTNLKDLLYEVENMEPVIEADMEA